MTKRERYDDVLVELRRRWGHSLPSRQVMMFELVDALWARFAKDPYSWAGFYLLEPDKKSLTLGPRRDKPACSPIEMHGVCGRSALEGRTLIVDDVHALGSAHIVCDPKNLSEICVPARGPDGAVWGVLDVDSEKLAAFDDADREGLERLLAFFAR
jgi:L-methionine (R)-S-oxide reductase